MSPLREPIDVHGDHVAEIRPSGFVSRRRHELTQSASPINSSVTLVWTFNSRLLTSSLVPIFSPEKYLYIIPTLPLAPARKSLPVFFSLHRCLRRLPLDGKSLRCFTLGIFFSIYPKVSFPDNYIRLKNLCRHRYRGGVTLTKMPRQVQVCGNTLSKFKTLVSIARDENEIMKIFDSKLEVAVSRYHMTTPMLPGSPVSFIILGNEKLVWSAYRFFLCSFTKGVHR